MIKIIKKSTKNKYHASPLFIIIEKKGKRKKRYTYSIFKLKLYNPFHYLNKVQIVQISYHKFNSLASFVENVSDSMIHD